MSRRILVTVSLSGDIRVEADGFKGKGCEVATKAIEEALGKRGERTLKPEHRQTPVAVQHLQSLGES